MSLKKCIGLVSIAIFGSAMAVGCSSSSESTPASDAGADVKSSTRPDTGVPPVEDAGGQDSSVVCKPDDESAFKPTWIPPTAKSTACTQEIITAYHTCLKDSQTATTSPPSCAAFQAATITAAAKACLQCIETDQSAKAYGPVIVHKGLQELNIPGCIAIVQGDTAGTGCGPKFQAASQCTFDACSTNCPVSDNASFTAEQDCEKTAGADTCAKFETDAACADDAGAATATCLSATTYDELWDKIVPIFCLGPSTTDGGTDSSTTDAAPVDASDDGG